MNLTRTNNAGLDLIIQAGMRFYLMVAIRDAIKKLGYVRTFFGLTPDQHIKMEFEKRKGL
jgi:hypothetical protein